MFLKNSASDEQLENKILTPAMLKQRKKLHTLVASSNKLNKFTYKEFMKVLMILKEKDNSFRSKYKGLLAVMKCLSDFLPSRSFFIRSLDKYLVRNLY